MSRELADIQKMRETASIKDINSKAVVAKDKFEKDKSEHENVMPVILPPAQVAPDAHLAQVLAAQAQPLNQQGLVLVPLPPPILYRQNTLVAKFDEIENLDISMLLVLGRQVCERLDYEHLISISPVNASEEEIRKNLSLDSIKRAQDYKKDCKKGL